MGEIEPGTLVTWQQDDDDRFRLWTLIGPAPAGLNPFNEDGLVIIWAKGEGYFEAFTRDLTAVESESTSVEVTLPTPTALRVAAGGYVDPYDLSRAVVEALAPAPTSGDAG